ncbi:MAG: hypothetical protein E5X14_31180, partial [Mesorhizobium sp.]
LDIADTDGPAGDYKLSVTTTGDLSTGDKPLPEKLTLSQGKRQAFSFPLIAQTAGDASITVKLAHTGGTEVEQTLYLP